MSLSQTKQEHFRMYKYIEYYKKLIFFKDSEEAKQTVEKPKKS